MEINQELLNKTLDTMGSDELMEKIKVLADELGGNSLFRLECIGITEGALEAVTGIETQVRTPEDHHKRVTLTRCNILAVICTAVQNGFEMGHRYAQAERRAIN